MSSKKCPDVKDLRRLLCRLAVELREAQPEVTKEEYLLALHERYGALITIEQRQYALDEYGWSVARKAMKDLDAAEAGIVEDRQLVLPGSLRHVKVPRALPIELNGAQKTVSATYAGIPEGDAYTESLKGNANACFGKLTDWLEVWTPARKVMVDHPGWDFGRALEYLAKKEEEEGPE